MMKGFILTQSAGRKFSWFIILAENQGDKCKRKSDKSMSHKILENIQMVLHVLGKCQFCRIYITDDTDLR